MNHEEAIEERELSEREAIGVVLRIASRFGGGLTPKEEEAVAMLREKYW